MLAFIYYKRYVLIVIVVDNMMAKLYKFKIPLDTVVKILNAMDVDEDKCVSVGELFDYVKLIVKKAKKLAKYEE